MSGEKVDFSEAVQQAAPSASRQLDRSTIAFPYLDLDTAVEVAQAVYGRAGLGNCEIDELAAQMDQTVSGAFRLKTSTAKLFGFVDKDGRSSFRLTPLGQTVVHGETEAQARAEAFLEVPLYAAVYERYRGHLLPPARALEREMQALGVAPKQTDRARQIFERSARQAGFFNSGEDRLVAPKLDRLPETRPTDDRVADRRDDALGRAGRGGSGGGGDDTLHPFIQGLLDELPERGSEWPVADRVKWLRLASNAFDMIYKGGGEITVSTPSANSWVAPRNNGDQG